MEQLRNSPRRAFIRIVPSSSVTLALLFYSALILKKKCAGLSLISAGWHTFVTSLIPLAVA